MSRWEYYCTQCGIMLTGVKLKDGRIVASDRGPTAAGDPRPAICWTCAERVEKRPLGSAK